MNAEHFTSEQLVTLQTACSLLCLSRTTLWRRINFDPAFPKPISIGCRSPRFFLSDLQGYLADQKNPSNPIDSESNNDFNTLTAS